MRIVMLSQAEEDLDQIASYYRGQNERLSSEFEAAVRHTFEQIRFHPLAWAPLTRRIRRCLLHRFPYGIIYRVTEESILILAVVHNQRGPDTWRDRLRRH